MRVGLLSAISFFLSGLGSLVWASEEPTTVNDYCEANSKVVSVKLVMRNKPEIAPVRFSIPVSYIRSSNLGDILNPSTDEPIDYVILEINRADMSPYCLRDNQYYKLKDVGISTDDGSNLTKVYLPPEEGDGWSKGFDTQRLYIKINRTGRETPLDPKEFNVEAYPYRANDISGFDAFQKVPVAEEGAKKDIVTQMLIPKADNIGEPGYVICDISSRLNNDGSFKKLVYSPCSAFTTYMRHNVSLHYSFHRDLLPQFAKVDAQVRAIIDKYIQKEEE